MGKVDYAFIADLDWSQVSDSLKQIDKEVDTLASKFDKKFKTIEQSGTTSFKKLAKDVTQILNSIEQKMGSVGAINLQAPSQDREAVLIQQEKIRLQREELKLTQDIEKATARTRNQANQAIRQEIARYPQLNQELDKVAQKYGAFNVVLGRNRSELNAEEKEVVDLIQKYPQLAAKIDQTTKEFGELTIGIKQSNVSTATGGNTLAGFASKLGLATGAAFILTNALRNLARNGVEALKSLVVESVKTSQQFDQVKISLRGILGTEDLGKVERLFADIRQQSRGLGVDVAGVANAFLPIIDSVDQLDAIGESVQELVQLSVVTGRRQTTGDAIRAIAEAFSGDFISIRRLFELTDTEIGKLREGLKEAGTQGFLDSLGDVLGKRGIEIDEFRQTTQFQFSILKETAQDFRAALGKPIDDKLAVFLQGLNTFIEENFEEFEALGTAIGEFIATITEDIGDTFLDALESGDISKIVDDLADIAEFVDRIRGIFTAIDDSTFGVLNEIMDGLSDLSPLFRDVTEAAFGTEIGWLELIALFTPLGQGVLAIKTAFNLLDTALSDMTGRDIALLSFENLNQVLQTMTKIVGIAMAGWNAFFANLGYNITHIDDLISGKLSLKDFFLEGHATGVDAMNASLQRTVDILDEQQASINARNAAIEESRQPSEGFNERDRLESELATYPDQLKAINDEILELETGLNADRLELQKELSQKRMDIIRKQKRDEIDLEIDLSRKREDLERKVLQSLQDLRLKFTQDVQDGQVKFNRKIADIDRKLVQEEAKLQEESAKERIDVELEYQRQLAEMRRQFLFDSEEAIRQNDALAFLRLRRKFEFELNEARINKDQEVEDAKAKEDEKRAELKQKRDQEVEDAKLARDRDLADLIRNLADQIAKIKLNRQQDLANLAITEARKREDMLKSFARQIADYNIFTANKLATFNNAHQAEITQLAQAEQRKFELAKKWGEARLKLQLQFFKQQQQFVQSPEALRFEQNTPEAGGSRTGDLSSLRTRAIYVAEQKGQLTQELEQRILRAFQGGNGQALLNILGELAKLPRLAGGGDLRAGQSAIVGDGGIPEIFTPKVAGTVTPFSAAIDALRQASGSTLPVATGNSIDNSQNFNVDLSMLDPNALSPGQLAIVTQVVREVLLQAAQ